MTFGLLGRKLTHSFSPLVHAALGDSGYRLFETEDPVSFLRRDDFDGLNVTIPYKEIVAGAMTALDDVARRTGAVNTVVRRDGRLFGYNTDYAGIVDTFRRHGIDPAGQKAAIIGNGGAAKTVVLCLTDLGAQVELFCRTPRHPGERPLTDAYGDHTILVNATPVGMHPDDTGLPVDLAGFPHLVFVFDLVYNPLRTRLLLAAKARGIPAANGLAMLVAQARRSRELFIGAPLADELAETALDTVATSTANLVLIGMPLSGKSMYARWLADRLGKTVFDTDAMIEETTGRTIPEIFATDGEASFRALEDAMVQTIADRRGLIVSTGGGMVLNARAMTTLAQNGVVFFLDKDYRRIMEADIHGRPLIQSPADVERLMKERRPLYEGYADHVIVVTGRKEETTDEIEAKFHAHFHRQRSESQPARRS